VAQGINTIEISFIDNEWTFNPPHDSNGNLPFSNMNDWTTYGGNASAIAYWNFVDWVVGQAKARNMLVMSFPNYTGGPYDDDLYSLMVSQSAANMTTFGTFLGNRYKASAGYGNVLWIHGGDLYESGNYVPSFGTYINNEANAIKAADPAALQTLHWARDQSAPAVSPFHGQSWYNVNAVYVNATGLTADIQTAYNYSPTMPFFMIEGLYEYATGNDSVYGSTLVMQHQALVTYLGGGLIGSNYANDKMWNGSAKGASYGIPITSWAIWNSSTGMFSPGVISVGNIGKLMGSRVWSHLVPDYSNTVVTSAKGSGLLYKATGRTSDGTTIIIWNPDTTNLPITVDMSKISSGGSVARVWSWNPSNNAATLIGTYATTGTQNFSPSAGMVLVIDDDGKGYPVPGSSPLPYSAPTLPAPTGLRISN
jgi:hypothetical protein